MRNIPQGTDKESVYIRNAVIVAELSPLIGKSFPCPAFGNRNVEVLFGSVSETATHASKNILSTMAAIRLVEALSKAKRIERTITPDSNRQKKMGFKKIHILLSELKGIGHVKIVVGEKANRRVVHYCITKNKTS